MAQQDPEKLKISGARSPEAVKGTDKRQNAQNPQDQAPEGLKRPVEPDAETEKQRSLAPGSPKMAQQM